MEEDIYSNDSFGLLTFLLVPAGRYLWFYMKCPNNNWMDWCTNSCPFLGLIVVRLVISGLFIYFPILWIMTKIQYQWHFHPSSVHHNHIRMLAALGACLHAVVINVFSNHHIDYASWLLNSKVSEISFECLFISGIGNRWSDFGIGILFILTWIDANTVKHTVCLS